MNLILLLAPAPSLEYKQLADIRLTSLARTLDEEVLLENTIVSDLAILHTTENKGSIIPGNYYFDKESGLRLRLTLCSLLGRDELLKQFDIWRSGLLMMQDMAFKDEDDKANSLACWIINNLNEYSIFFGWVIIEALDTEGVLRGFVRLWQPSKDRIILKESLAYPTGKGVGRAMDTFLMRYIQQNEIRFLHIDKIDRNNPRAIKHWRHLIERITGTDCQPPEGWGDFLNFKVDLSETKDPSAYLNALTVEQEKAAKKLAEASDPVTLGAKPVNTWAAYKKAFAFVKNVSPLVLPDYGAIELEAVLNKFSIYYYQVKELSPPNATIDFVNNRIYIFANSPEELNPQVLICIFTHEAVEYVLSQEHKLGRNQADAIARSAVKEFILAAAPDASGLLVNPSVPSPADLNDRLSNLLLELGYSSDAQKVLLAGFNRLLQRGGFDRFQARVALAQDSLELINSVKALFSFVYTEGLLEIAPSHPLVKLLVTGFNRDTELAFPELSIAFIPEEEKTNLKNILLSCSAIAQFAYIFLNILGCEVRGISAPNHALVGLPVLQGRILFVDFSLRIIMLVDINEYYEHKGAYLVLKENHKISDQELIRLERRDSAGLLDYSDLSIDELFSLLYGYIQITQDGLTCAIINNLGCLYDRLDKDVLAQGFYRWALKFNPKFSEAHNNLGSSYAELGEPAKAERHFKTALLLNPGNNEARHNLNLFERSAALARRVSRQHSNPAIQFLGVILFPRSAGIFFKVGWESWTKGAQYRMERFARAPPVSKEIISAAVFIISSFCLPSLLLPEELLKAG